MVIERIEAIHLLLLWEGEVSRGRLIDLLSLKETRASEVLRSFREAHPTWLEWNSVGKNYRATEALYRDFRTSNRHGDQGVLRTLSHYLSLLDLSDNEVAGNRIRYEVISSSFPDLTAPDPKVFSLIQQSILKGYLLELTYYSMKDPNGSVRQIAPRQLIQAGPRWHVRAYCFRSKGYRDFVLGRIGDGLRQIIPSDWHNEQSNVEDELWNQWLEVHLAAHPNIGPAQRELIEREYFGGEKERIERCRAAQLQYFLQEIHAAFTEAHDRQDGYYLTLLNRDELKPYLFNG